MVTGCQLPPVAHCWESLSHLWEAGGWGGGWIEGWRNKEGIHVLPWNWNSSYPVSLYNLIQIPQSVAHSYLNEHLTKSLPCFCFSWPTLGRLPRSVASQLTGCFSEPLHSLCFGQHTDIELREWAAHSAMRLNRSNVTLAACVRSDQGGNGVWSHQSSGHWHWQRVLFTHFRYSWRSLHNHKNPLKNSSNRKNIQVNNRSKNVYV